MKMDYVQSNENERLAYQLGEAGRLLGGVTGETVENWAKRGLIRITIVAGRKMVLHEDLLAVLGREATS